MIKTGSEPIEKLHRRESGGPIPPFRQQLCDREQLIVKQLAVDQETVLGGLQRGEEGGMTRRSVGA